eukprot:1174410-Rhodomonas_salina.1
MRFLLIDFGGNSTQLLSLRAWGPFRCVRVCYSRVRGGRGGERLGGGEQGGGRTTTLTVGLDRGDAPPRQPHPPRSCSSPTRVSSPFRTRLASLLAQRLPRPARLIIPLLRASPALTLRIMTCDRARAGAAHGVRRTRV